MSKKWVKTSATELVGQAPLQVIIQKWRHKLHPSVDDKVFVFKADEIDAIADLRDELRNSGRR